MHDEELLPLVFGPALAIGHDAPAIAIAIQLRVAPRAFPAAGVTDGSPPWIMNRFTTRWNVKPS